MNCVTRCWCNVAAMPVLNNDERAVQTGMGNTSASSWDTDTQRSENPANDHRAPDTEGQERAAPPQCEKIQGPKGLSNRAQVKSRRSRGRRPG